MVSKLKDISNLMESTESEIRDAIINEKNLKKKNPYKSKLRPYLFEIHLLRIHNADWAIVKKWLRVNKRIKMSEEGIRSFYHRNKHNVISKDENSE